MGVCTRKTNTHTRTHARARECTHSARTDCFAVDRFGAVFLLFCCILHCSFCFHGCVVLLPSLAVFERVLWFWRFLDVSVSISSYFVLLSRVKPKGRQKQYYLNLSLSLSLCLCLSLSLSLSLRLSVCLSVFKNRTLEIVPICSRIQEYISYALNFKDISFHFLKFHWKYKQRKLQVHYRICPKYLLTILVLKLDQVNFTTC